MKWLIRLGVIAILLAIVIAAAVFVTIDSIATTAVREGAAFATQTDVELEKVDVKVFDTAGEISKLDIKNPDGPLREKFDSFMVLGNGTAGINAGSLMSDKIVIPEVTISDIELSLVGLDDGTKNYEVILEALKRFQGDAPPEESKSEKQIEITKVVISNITVKYDFAKDPAVGAIPASGTIVIADDEPMVLENLGTGGVPISQITADIITDVLVQVMANMAGDLGGHMKGLAGSLVDTIGEVELGNTLKELDLGGNLEALGELGLDVGDLGLDAIEGISEEIGEGAGDVIRGIIGGDDSDDSSDDEENGSLIDSLSPF